MIKLRSVTINCVQLETMKSFYEMLGCDFEEFSVSKGIGGYKCSFAHFDLKLVSVAARIDSSHPVVQFSFQVGEIQKIYDRLVERYPAQILLEPFDSAGGSRFMVLLDPQGNSIELHSS